MLRTRELSTNFGVEVSEVDLAHADPAVLAEIVAQFHRSGAVLLRDQRLEPADFMRFVEAFGPPEDHTLQHFTLPGFPKIYLLSNRLQDGKPVGAHNDGIGWHTDYGYKIEPVMCTMLYGVIVPPEGSDTLFADLTLAYDELPLERQRFLDGLHLLHSYEYLMSTRSHGRAELTDDIRAENPDVVHPLIRTHPQTRRKALWVSGGTRGIAELPGPEGLALIDSLIAYATQERFVYRHKWRTNDVLVWDNRRTLHTGTLFDDTRYIREMFRAWVKGDRPF